MEFIDINLRSVLELNHDVYRSSSYIYWNHSHISSISEKYGSLKIIDLRTLEEKSNDVKLELADRFQILSFPLVSKFSRICGDRCKYEDDYMKMLDFSKWQVQLIIREIIRPDCDAVIFCCNMGKDRTGVISYLLSSLFSRDNNLIKSDYMKTKDFLMRSAHLFQHSWEKRNVSKEDYIESVLPNECDFNAFDDAFRKKYTSANNFLNTD